MRTLLVTLLYCWPIHGLLAAELVYMANEHQSKWTVSTSPVYCELRHEVTDFGEAIFSHRAGLELELLLTTQHRAPKPKKVSIRAIPPQWRHDLQPADMGPEQFEKIAVGYRLKGVMVLRLLDELSAGMFPVFTYEEGRERASGVKVTFSAVNVWAALRDFNECRTMLLPADYSKLHTSSLYFYFNRTKLREKSAKRLADIARYIAVDDTISKVRIEGHTDSRGFRTINNRLGMRRAESIKKALLEKGVSNELIEVNTYGESKPIASNRSDKGRALNRRVVLKLLR